VNGIGADSEQVRCKVLSKYRVCGLDLIPRRLASSELPTSRMMRLSWNTGVQQDALPWQRMDIQQALDRYTSLKLAALGQLPPRSTGDPEFLQLAGPLLRNIHQKDQLLHDALCPVDTRIQSFLDRNLRDVRPHGVTRLPSHTLTADLPGMARTLSFPPGEDRFQSPYLHSYRVAQGVLHNPKNDRRTTQGVFHIAEGGLPIPKDKIAVPKAVFGSLLDMALRPPAELMTLPYTARGPEAAGLFVSLLIRPIVCPATSWMPEKSMEIRFFAPGTLVSNLDFVECLFGNGGDPYLPENDAALDVLHWTGHTGCVILAPHLAAVGKRDLGLPHAGKATERQKRDGMCWSRPDEIYNGGQPFKITCRDESGVTVTILADNYYGYCKKEVKTQISFAANLYGLCEEEHAGGAIAFPTYVLGRNFIAGRTFRLKPATFESAVQLLGSRAELRPEGYAVDRRFPSVMYVPESSRFSVSDGAIFWESQGQTRQISLRPEEVYVLPSGYRVRLEKRLADTPWRLVGTTSEGTLCHKPATVSGGGKSEIAKSLSDLMLKGPVFVKDYRKDMDEVEAILHKDFSSVFRKRAPDHRSRRPILSVERSLGSVIKLLTPSEDYTDEHNRWLCDLPQTIRQLVFTVKRYYRPEWGDSWWGHFSVDRINGFLGHELKFDGERLVSNYLRVGYDLDGSWRIYKLRPDFHPADKVQVEDDITASIVLPREALPYPNEEYKNPSVKLVANCEAMLFQRPDEAVHRGADRQAEADIATPGTFLSNFEPLTREDARWIVDHVVEFDRYSEPMKRLLANFVSSGEGTYVVSSAHPRLIDGKPSKNPRYLQRRPDLVRCRDTYLAEITARLNRGIPSDSDVYFPVNAVLPGRRNNPPDRKLGIAPLAVYNPIHYQETPELFMEFISSLTGRSPSTTGFGSEGALTKGPFNALLPVIDVNNALISMLLTEYPGITTSAGYVGPHYRVDHDISMLAPEIWCRMKPEERDPRFLIDNGYLEKVDDIVFDGRTVLASRLGYRITARFVDVFLGRIFETPDAVFPEDLLRPEKQDPALFAAGVEAIVESQRRVAQAYFEDGSLEDACPPLRALLEIMVNGSSGGVMLDDPRLRREFTREAVLGSDWYLQRLRTRQGKQTELWQRHLRALEEFRASGMEVPLQVDLATRLRIAEESLSVVSSPEYVRKLTGTIGADVAICTATSSPA
jgi:phosphoenolpyruvate carboxykinase (diphosphate)